MATYDLTKSIPSASSIQTGDILNCPYSGKYKSITLPKGKYKLECWGAKGIYSSASPSSSFNYNYGGYASGVLNLTSEKTFYIYVGGQPGATGSTSYYNGGWNGGGGKRSSSTKNNAPGSGATDICLTASDVTLTGYCWKRTDDSYLSRIIVAGGGGGGRTGNAMGCGGYAPSTSTSASYNGGMTAGGITDTSNYEDAGFGYGASTSHSSDDKGCGGGGWYGGGSHGDYYGGGGSSFVWSDDYAQYVPSGYTPTEDLKMTNVSLIQGGSSMPLPSGSTGTGQTGNGYARITALDVEFFSITAQEGSQNTWLITYDGDGSLVATSDNLNNYEVSLSENVLTIKPLKISTGLITISNVDNIDYESISKQYILNILPGFCNFIKIDGQWKKSDYTYVKIDGDWKSAKNIFIKSNGEWKALLVCELTEKIVLEPFTLPINTQNLSWGGIHNIWL